MSNDLNTGVDNTQVAAENTGVNESQVAAGDDSSVENFDVDTLIEEGNTEPEGRSLGDLLNDEGDSGKVENSGDDNPPDVPDESKPQAEEPALPQQKDIAQSRAFAIRLQQERQKIEAEIEARVRKEYAEKNAASLEDRIEGRAHQLMAKYPKDIQSLDYAKRVARQELESEAPIQTQEPNVPQDDAEANKQAWKESLITEEPMLKLATGDPSMTWETYADKDPVFKKVLSMGFRPMEAHTVAQAAKVIMEKEIAAAKTAGGQQVIDSLKSSNSTATTPPVSTNSGRKHKSIPDLIKDTPIEELNKLLENGPVNLG